MLPIKWSNYHEIPYVNVEIAQFFYNAYCIPKYIFTEKYFNIWDHKIYSPINYLQSFYVAALIEECGTSKNHPLEMF